MPTVQAALRESGIECYNNQIAYPIYSTAPKTGLPPAFDRIICRNDAFIRTLKMAEKVSGTQASVFIHGESGVGKELVVEAIHKHGKEEKDPFIKVNCAAIPDTLFESELFGYEKGAFTGALQNGKKGKFELANNGTLFLDEIGELPMSMQVKLLRVLQEKEVEPVGATKSVSVNFRLVTATNRDLEQMVRAGEFREDLFYRLNVIQLNVPPLRQRKQDIPDLVHSFLCQLSQEYGECKSIDAAGLSVLMRYHWPGNVRELKNVIEQAYILSEHVVITDRDLPDRLQIEEVESIEKGEDTCYNLNEIIAKTELETILAVLELTGNNKSKSSEILGISRRSFYQKLEKYDLS